jgi:hypothetical protein
LLTHGFRRKGTLYYRLNGSILQGIVLVKTESSYIIRYNIFPYWVYGSESGFVPSDKSSLEDGSWADGNIEDFSGVYYTAEDIAGVKKNLNQILEIINGFVLPQLDIVNDECSYYAFMSNKGKWENISQKAILRIASLQNNFALAYTHLRFLRLQAKMGCYAMAIQMITVPFFSSLERYTELPPHMPKPAFPPMPDPDKNPAIIRNYLFAKNATFSLLEEKIQSDDLHWIDSVYEEDCLRVGKMLKEDLGIDVD